MHDARDAGSDDTKPMVPRPSREEIESLCVLHAVGSGGCSTADLAAGLGFSRELGRTLDRAVQQLVASGCLEVRSEGIFVSSGGNEWMRSRLAALGV